MFFEYSHLYSFRGNEGRFSLKSINDIAQLALFTYTEFEVNRKYSSPRYVNILLKHYVVHGSHTDE